VLWKSGLLLYDICHTVCMLTVKEVKLPEQMVKKKHCFSVNVMKAVRSTHSLEVPVTRGGECLVSCEVCLCF